MARVVVNPPDWVMTNHTAVFLATVCSLNLSAECQRVEVTSRSEAAR